VLALKEVLRIKDDGSVYVQDGLKFYKFGPDGRYRGNFIKVGQGPGELGKAGKVILGTDPVAIDSYGAPLVRLRAADVLMITKSAEWGLGQMDVAKPAVKEIAG
jgi:hypothetical protein